MLICKSYLILKPVELVLLQVHLGSKIDMTHLEIHKQKNQI